jgi:uridylate kinase
MSEVYKYNRVLLKISGETLKGNLEFGYEEDAVSTVVKRVGKVVDDGVETALVVGAGNVWRGVMGTAGGLEMERVTADYMGMLATVMNALCLRDAFESAGFAAEVMTSVPMSPIAKPYSKDDAVKYLENGKVVIFACGTGSPFFTTDTTASLRALEIGAEVLLKATKVDGIYDKDPRKFPDAVRYSALTYRQALNDNLQIMDSTAFSMCRDNNLPIIVFDFFREENIVKVLQGDTSIGTLVS